jgi:hypothetical protein
MADIAHSLGVEQRKAIDLAKKDQRVTNELGLSHQCRADEFRRQ